MAEHVYSIFRIEETSMKKVASRAWLWFHVSLFFNPEDGGDIFLKNVD
jgi:hypothetical protein